MIKNIDHNMENVKALFPDQKYKNGRYPYFFENHEEYLVEDPFTKRYGTGIENIKVINNFFSKDECEEAISFSSNFEIKSERDHCYPLHMADNFSMSSDFGQKYNSYTELISNKMIAAAEKEWETSLTKHNACMLMVHPLGSYLDPHTDILDIHYENNDKKYRS